MAQAFGTTTTTAFQRTLEDVAQRSPVLAEFLALPGPTVRIHVPFSGAFDEASALREFLVARMPAGWRSVAVEASDIHLPPVMGFRDVKDPRFHFSARIIDLSRQDMPDCDLAIGLHPQVVGYETDGWERIIRQVVTHSRAAIFTTWLQIEHDRLTTMLRQNGCEVQSWQNPHAVSELAGVDDLSKRFHYVVVACRPGPGRPPLALPTPPPMAMGPTALPSSTVAPLRASPRSPFAGVGLPSSRPRLPLVGTSTYLTASASPTTFSTTTSPLSSDAYHSLLGPSASAGFSSPLKVSTTSLYSPVAASPSEWWREPSDRSCLPTATPFAGYRSEWTTTSGVTLGGDSAASSAAGIGRYTVGGLALPASGTSTPYVSVTKYTEPLSFGGSQWSAYSEPGRHGGYGAAGLGGSGYSGTSGYGRYGGHGASFLGRSLQ